MPELDIYGYKCGRDGSATSASYLADSIGEESDPVKNGLESLVHFYEPNAALVLFYL